MLEAGFEVPDRPCILLLHGFPELAFSWREVIPAIAAAGYYVVAPDQRGYGRTTGWDPRYDGAVDSFRTLNLVRDALGVVAALGRRHVAALVGHDVGSVVAAWCALLRPDVFRSVVLMSAPFGGAPDLPIDTANEKPTARPNVEAVYDELERLPRPSKYYQRYFSSREANDDMLNAPGLHDFLRAYFHFKSGDWPGNDPHPLAALTAKEFAKMPAYYVMEHDKGMAATVAAEMPSAATIQACQWLPEQVLKVYVEEYSRTGFQGALQWYRCQGPKYVAEMQTYSGLTINVPSCFIAGRNDWGIFQVPGSFERMQSEACTDFRGCHLLEGAGHWIQQERAREVSQMILDLVGNL